MKELRTSVAELAVAYGAHCVPRSERTDEETFDARAWTFWVAETAFIFRRSLTAPAGKK